MEKIDIPLDFNIGDIGFDAGEVDLTAFDFSANIADEIETRYIKPPPPRQIKKKNIRYEYAQQLAQDLDIGEGTRHMALVSGNFIFGDFIEALFVAKNIHTKRLQISTLSMSQENIDSLANLMNGGFVDSLDLIVSAYFYAHERGKGGLIPYLHKTLDKDNSLQIAVAGIHTKVVTFETDGGKCITMHGSANLRSSRCVEQVMIEEGRELFQFFTDMNESILKQYSTIKKEVRASKLWEAMNEH